MTLLKLLTRTLGPHKAVSVYFFLRNWGVGTIVLSAVLTVAWFLFVYLSEGRQAETTQTGTVLGIAAAPSETSTHQRLILDLELEDGNRVRLLVQTRQVRGLLDTACVTRYRGTKFGRVTYRLNHVGRCTAQP